MKILFRAPVMTASGYGVHSRQLLKALVDAGYDLFVQSIRWGETSFLNSDPSLDWIKTLVERQQPSTFDAFIQVTIPNEFKRDPRARLNVGVTAGIEVDRVSPEWLIKCNSEVDIVVVPSKHSADAFGVVYQAEDGRQLRLERPIVVIHEGVDTATFNVQEVPVGSPSIDGMPDQNIVFVGLGLDKPAGHDRKNVSRLVEWFCQSFSGRADVGLILKTSVINGSLLDFEVTKKRITQIRSSFGELPKIRLIHGRISEQEMADVYNDPRVTAAVSLTHGEGFGLPLIEAAACGLPVIATGWSGHVDFLKDAAGVLIEHDLVEIPEDCVWPGVMEAGSRWSEPRHDAFVAAVESSVGGGTKPRDTLSAQKIADSFSLEVTGRRFVELIKNAHEQIADARPSSREELIVSLKRRFVDRKDTVIFTMPMSAGDVYLSTALCEPLRTRHPGKKIMLATLPQYRSIVDAGPWDEVIDWLPWMADVTILEDVFEDVYTPNLAIQMSHSNWVHRGRGRQLLAEMAFQCGIDAKDLVPVMGADEPCAAVDQIVSIVAEGKRCVALHAGSGAGQWAARRYLGWDDVVSNLKRSGAAVVQIGSADDIEVPGVDLDLRGKSSYRQLPQVLSSCSALVCIDSLPMHMAATISTPIIAIYGSSYPTTTGPWRSNKLNVLIETPSRYTCDRACYKNTCSVSESSPCVNEITPDVIVAAVCKTLRLEQAPYVEHRPKISGYTHVLDAKTHGYPFVQSIRSMLGFCDEVIVVDGGSNDGTVDDIKAIDDPRVKLISRKWDWNEPGMDGMQKAFARAMCSPDAEFLWQQDADEVVHEDDYAKVTKLCKKFPADLKLLHLPVIELWGDQRHVRTDRHSWKWRISRNDFRITHGIAAHARAIDRKTGRLHAKKGMSDGCEYIDVVTADYIPHAGFYSAELDRLRNTDPNGYGEKMNAIFAELPSVFHYSWCDLPRKVRNFRDFWDKTWSNLYNDEQQESRFPDVVTDDDVVRKADELKSRGGEHGPAPLFELRRDPPAIMDGWDA